MKYSGRIYGASFLALTLLAGCDPRPASETPDESSQVTFTREIAPLVFSHCAPCHRPGEAEPDRDPGDIRVLEPRPAHVLDVEGLGQGRQDPAGNEHHETDDRSEQGRAE